MIRPAQALWELVRRRPRTSAALGLVLLVAATAGGAHLWALRHWEAAERDLRQERYPEARAHIEDCLRVWPWSPATHLLAARIERLGGDPHAAEAHLNECLRLQRQASDATQLEWYLLRAQNGDVDEVAGGLWYCVQNNHPRTLEILETLARVYTQELRYRQAHVCLNKWLERQPDNLRALELRGEVQERLDSRDRATRDYERALELAPDHWQTRKRLVEILLGDSNPTEAEPHLAILARDHADDPEVMAGLARCRFLQGEVPEARRLFDAVLALHPEDFAALLYRGKLELADEHAAEAETWVRRALRVDPLNLDAHGTLYRALKQQGNRDAEAAAELERTEQIKRDVERLTFLLREQVDRSASNAAPPCEAGTLLLRLGQEQSGLFFLHQALKIDPKYRPAHEALAAFYAERDPQQAEEHRRLAEGAEPGAAAKTP
jgi:tetratricopeptide (TPR) repeat protein